jgi:hypothetical protein
MKLSLLLKLTWRLASMLAVILLLASAAWAQETPPEVWVTTQHNANLRVGPGTNWEIITLLPAGTTLQASGRIFDWVQVLYTPEGATEPSRGWLWRDLLIWTGDLNSLPLDGVEPEPFIRVQGYTLTLTPEMIVYHNENYGIGARVTEPLSCVEVEYTGRLGRGDVFWMQFWCNGEYYWVGSHNFFDIQQDESGAFTRYVPVESFNYHYGRMLAELGNTGYIASVRLNTMRNIWNSLASGEQVSCANPPQEIEQAEITTADLTVEPDFSAPLAAMETAVDDINAAVILFQDTCDQLAQDPFIDPSTVSTAQSYLAEAQQYLYLARQFYVPLANRDPYSG